MRNRDLYAFTVVLKDFPAPDLGYSKLMASRLGINQEVISASLDDLEKLLPDVISVP